MLSKFIVVNVKHVGYFIRQARRSGTHQGCRAFIQIFLKDIFGPHNRARIFFSLCVCVHECMCVSMGNINW